MLSANLSEVAWRCCLFLAIMLLIRAIDVDAQGLVKDINPAGGSAPRYLTHVDGTLFFAADDGTHGGELWSSNRTEAGTRLVKDIVPGFAPSEPRHLTTVAGMIFFTANDSTHGRELWRSDGTTEGTKLVKDINTEGSSIPFRLTAFGSTLFFTADDGVHGRELWKTDGTEAGTMLVKDIRPDGDTFFLELVPVGNMLFFSADNKLWRTDGTEPGTVLLYQYHGTPRFLTNIDGTLFFQGKWPREPFGRQDTELWKSDGTQDGTVLVKDIYPGVSPSHPRTLTNFNGTLFFVAWVVENLYYGPGRELWKSDGTADGTVLVKDIWPGRTNSDPFNLTVVGNTLFFAATDSTHGDELWRSDGTKDGTILVRDIEPGRDGAFPQYLTDVQGTLFFAAYEVAHGWELWRSDGTEDGTQQTMDLRPGVEGSDPEELTAIDHMLFFTADDGVHGQELWSIASTSVDVEKEPTIPALPVFSPPYPNPFREHASLQFSLPRAALVTVTLYDALGRQVSVLYEGRTAPGQRHMLRIDAQNLPSGTYFVRLIGPNLWETCPIVLIR